MGDWWTELSPRWVTSYHLKDLLPIPCFQWLSDTAARDLRVRTARLPIKEHMVPQGNPHKLDLPIDIVVKILITAHHNGDWDKALFEHFPKRKGWVLRREVAFM